MQHVDAQLVSGVLQADLRTYSVFKMHRGVCKGNDGASRIDRGIVVYGLLGLQHEAIIYPASSLDIKE